MNIVASKQFKKSYDKLSHQVRIKTKKAIGLLQKDFFYPSLHTKKMEGNNFWEARIDRSYRFTFKKKEETITLRTVKQHDEGLGNK